MLSLTPQEQFWAGEFGDEYIDRNPVERFLPSRIALFANILKHTSNVKSILELGANIGGNLVALRSLVPNGNFTAVEINAKAVEMLKRLNYVSVHHSSIFDFSLNHSYDFVFTSGVLIHLPPEKLSDAYSILFEASAKYICMIEYYNPTPLEVPYRGHAERLFKRDFAGELMDQYEKKIKLLSYGFVYHRDCNFPMDDATWFLLEKC